MPIKDSGGDVIGVAQVINKMNGECFSEIDEKVSVLDLKQHHICGCCRMCQLQAHCWQLLSKWLPHANCIHYLTKEKA